MFSSAFFEPFGLISVFFGFYGYLVVYDRNWGYWWFPVVEYPIISDNWVFLPVFGGLLAELGVLVVSSG